VNLVAGSGNVISVDVEHQIRTEPTFLVHVGFRVFVVGARIVNVRGLGFAEKVS
jgi:hypothetical protein